MSSYATLMAINHDNDYHGDINYGNLYPEDWYWFDTSDEDNQEDQQSTWYQGPR